VPSSSNANRGNVLRVAVIGCGFQGRVHLEAFRQLPEIEVIAICDLDSTRRESLASEFGVANTYADYRELLDRHHAVDIVTVCTMPDTHLSVTLAAFDAGAHVLCEKPLALDLDQGCEMLQAARAADRVLGVGFNMRFSDNALALRKLVDRGCLGAPLYARAWGRASEPPWWGRHYERPISGGGALAATAVHLVDLALWMADFPKPITASATAKTVFPAKRGHTAPGPGAAASYTVEDLVSAHVRFQGGFAMTVEGAWVWDRPGWNYSFELQGESGLIEFDPLRATLDRDGGLVDATPEAARPIDWALDFPISVGRGLADFVAAITDGRSPVVRPEQALVVQAITDAIYLSAEKGIEVSVPDTEMSAGAAQ
jgi:predicted dehydrogenase